MTRYAVTGAAGHLGRLAIESLIEHGAAQCAVVVLPGGIDRAASLVAFVTGTSAVTPRALRASVGRLLGPYAVPRIVRRVDEIPLTTAGKADRQRLTRDAGAS